MIKLVTHAAVALALAAAPAWAQTSTGSGKTPSGSSATPGTSSAGGTKGTGSMGTDGNAVAKFKAADKNATGMLEGDELAPYRAQLSSVDTDKDGKISQAEFTVGMTAGHIK